ncbi:VPLPA-CTERM sorting domain-containing protein [Roseibacterium sp. SDUM158016]|uniref:VPLPA-CTERM sorting domain-containing protein n=1 Tax=Roseicyclus sediminis TaxID=2980997 RepID=UPI0021D1A2C5|nr:VPLPA-CTERM sorting domain-containing protein [Roseibacterium sp. SDUM158016]MCU4653348.1 VPLPA-CTERM sorting domain-containing protein [Roseibacterium sp. SDUM158016]
MYRNLKKLVLACVGAVMLSGGAASATVIDFTGGGTGAGSGVSLSCDAFGIFNSGCSVTYNNAGLGVNGNPDTQPDQIDGSPIFSSERITLSFAQDMRWNNITFGRWDRNDDARLEADNGLSVQYTGNSPVVDLGGYVSSRLTVIAYGDIRNDCTFLCLGGNDSFTVASIDVAPVPLPAAGWLLLAGIGGLAVARSRKKAA